MHELLVSIVLIVIAPQDAQPKPPYEATVTVEDPALKDRDSLTRGKTLAWLKLRSTVTVVEIKGDFAKVKATVDGKALEGWLPMTAIQDTPTYTSKVQAAGGDPKAGAESHGYTKGFDPKTEGEFKSSEHLEPEYAKIDAIESTEFRKNARKREEMLGEFRRNGKLGEFRK